MPADRRTTQAVAEAAARGPGTTDPLLGELRRSGLLPLLVLHFIAEAPTYGNQLMERIETLSGGLLAVNPNTMYPLLRSLEARGLVAGEWEHPERRSRRFYRVTDAGRAERAPAFVDGFSRLVRVDPGWPAEGSVEWESTPGGRGRVVETVERYEPRVG